MIKTNHKYIGLIPVKKTDTALILGTIHPHNTDEFQIDFFYGNRNSIWNILSQAFPEIDFSTKESIIRALSENRIWISDIISGCERENERITTDKLLHNLEINHDQILNGLQKSEIKTIFFTSGFGKNNAAKLFCETFSISADLNSEREFEIPETVFGRKIKGIVLFSPSGQANIGISRNKLFLSRVEYYREYDKPVNQFKIDFYRKAFSNQFSISK